MTELVHGKVMHLVNQNDYDLLQNMKKRKLSNPKGLEETDEVRMKEFNDQFLRGEKEKKFKEDVEWDKVEKRLTPIIHPDSALKNKNLIEKTKQTKYSIKTRMYSRLTCVI